MNKFLQLIGIAFCSIALLNGIQSKFAWGDEIEAEYAHVQCPGTATCEARSSNPGTPAVCGSAPDPCGTYTGPSPGVTCGCDGAPSSTTLCRCYAT